MPKRSYKVFSSWEKVKVFNWIRKEEKYDEIGKVYDKTLLSQIVKKGKEICASFAVIHQREKFMVIVHDTCIDKMGKVLNLYNKIFSEIPVT